MHEQSPPKPKSSLGLLPQIAIAIALGVLCGFVFPDPLTRIFITFKNNTTVITMVFIMFCVMLFIASKCDFIITRFDISTF